MVSGVVFERTSALCGRSRMFLEGEGQEALGSGGGYDPGDFRLIQEVENRDGDGAIESRDEGCVGHAVDGCGWTASLIGAGDSDPGFGGLMDGDRGCGNWMAERVVDA